MHAIGNFLVLHRNCYLKLAKEFYASQVEFAFYSTAFEKPLNKDVVKNEHVIESYFSYK